MKTVFLVVGRTGEYSETSEWVVCAYAEKETAQQHADLANKAAEGSENMDWDEQEKLESEFIYDRGIECNYTGTTYKVQEVPMVCHVDEYVDRFPVGDKT